MLIVVKNKVRRGFNQKYGENATVSISMSVYRLKWTCSLKSRHIYIHLPLPGLRRSNKHPVESAVTLREYAFSGLKAECALGNRIRIGQIVSHLGQMKGWEMKKEYK